jgi:hypothetical protein
MVVSCKGDLSLRRTACKVTPVRLGDQALGAYGLGTCWITYLTRKSIISPKLQLLSGHSEEKSLAIYHDFALTDAAAEYEAAMRTFPVR